MCLTDPISTHDHIVIAFVSSVIPVPPLATDVLLDPGDSSYWRTGLRVRSVVRLHRLATITSLLIRRDLGELSQRHLEDVEHRLRVLFGL